MNSRGIEDDFDGGQLESILIAELAVIRKEGKSIKERIERLNRWVSQECSLATRDGYLLEAEELNEQLNDQMSEVYGLVSRATRGLYSPSEVADWMAHCEAEGCPRVPITDKTLSFLVHLEKVPNGRLREAFLKLKVEGACVGHLAIRTSEYLRKLEEAYGANYGSASLVKDDKVGDTSAIERMLGTRPTVAHGKKTIRIFIDYFQAVALCDTLGVEYRYVGV